MRRINFVVSKEERDEFDEYDIQYIQLLERLNLFWELIDTARARLGITDNFLSRYPNESSFKQAQEESRKIVKLFDLPSSWLHTLADFIIMDKFVLPQDGIFLSGKMREVTIDEKAGKLKVDRRTPDLHIIIKQQMSIKALQKWVENNRKVIRERLDQLPKRNTLVKSRFEIKCRILELSESGMRPSKIEDVLRNEFPEDIISSAEISTIVDQVKQVVKRTPRR